MSQSIRQNNLFAAEDWQKIYRAFTNVNFVSYDFDTLRQSLVEYIRINYPEDFNDFIDSSEFIAIIDLLSWLGENLAFRVDLNTRENFLDTAERRESILRLAKLLSYKPKRNIAAKGFLKVTGVRTNFDVFDSNGNNLNGIRVDWNDPNNPDWYEQLILILNASFIKSHKFGQPVQFGTDAANVNVQVYEIESAYTGNPGVFNFSAIVDSESIPFECVNVSWDKTNNYTERYPNPFGNYHIMYKNDGEGNQSINTGFFVYFKQGTLEFQDFNISIPVENRLLPITVNNINNSDVWVENIDTDGNPTIVWEQVPFLPTNNIIYNDIKKDSRNIFEVLTEENDQISVRFGDGKFSTIAFGLTRVYYRTSYGDRTVIRPTDIQNIAITIPFITENNLTKDLTLFLSLQETITNGAPAETNDEIRSNAPQVYYTQNRMVSGEDYNSFPLADGAIIKAKAINRTYAGHNRFVDINDPTGTYQNTNVIGDDGLLYMEIDNNYAEVSNNSLTPDQIVSDILIPFLGETEFQNFLKQVIKNYAPLCAGYTNLYTIPPINLGQNLMWDRISGSNYSSTGRFVVDSTPLPVPTTQPAVGVGVNIPAQDATDILREGSYIRFRDAGWVKVHSIIDNGKGSTEGFTLTGEGKIRLTKSVLEGDIVEEILPNIRFEFNSSEIDSIKIKILTNATFALFFNISSNSWEILDPPINLNSNGFDVSNNYSYCDDAKKWMILLENINSGGQIWRITARGLRWVFESVEDVRFFYANEYSLSNINTGRAVFDQINVFGTNKVSEIANNFIPPFIPGNVYSNGDLVNYNNTIYQAITSASSTIFNPSDWLPICPSLGEDKIIKIVDNYRYSDGYIEPRRVLVSFTDSDLNGQTDDPNMFDFIIFGNQNPLSPTANNLLFWEQYTSFDNYLYFKPITNVKVFLGNTLQDAIDAMNANYIDVITRPTWSDNTVAYVQTFDGSQYRYYLFDLENVYTVFDNIYPGFVVGDTKIPSEMEIADPSKYKTAIGRNNLNFLWKHFANSDNRIDPAVGNVIDIYALTTSYDYLLREYLLSSDKDAVEPQPPSATQLKIDFQDLEDLKMISDQIVWHPVKYKYLIGSKSEEELRAKIKVVKLPNATLGDGELKARIIELVNEYFAVENWDFGDTFYFSELAAYLHQGLTQQLASVVLVPINEEGKFGELYEVKSEPDEIFISSATVDDIDIIPTNTNTALRIS